MDSSSFTSTLNKSKALELAAAEGQADALKIIFERYPDSNANYYAIVDFNLPSSAERLLIFNLRSQSIRKFLVAMVMDRDSILQQVFQILLVRITHL
jgi:hypothetical protein